MSEIVFQIKTIEWSVYEQRSPILLQDENGPCPLIALVNTILLDSDIKSRILDVDRTSKTYNEVPFGSKEANSSSRETPSTADRLRELLNQSEDGVIEISTLLTTLGDCLLDMKHLDPSLIDQLLKILPLLHTGLDVNPDLTTGLFCEQDLATQIFNAFGLNFIHGWCRDCSKMSDLDEVFLRYKTYDSLQDFLLSEAENEDVRPQVNNWLVDNVTQLTNFGLLTIDSLMNSDSVAVFFRNNHFSTVYKGQDHDFYLLITDNVFSKRKNYVWQSLNSVSGSDDLYFTGDFVPLLDGDGNVNSDDQNDESALLAKELQEQEDSAYAQKLQTKFNSSREGKTKTTSKRVNTTKDSERVPMEPENARFKKGKQGHTNSKRDPKKKSSCIIS